MQITHSPPRAIGVALLLLVGAGCQDGEVRGERPTFHVEAIDIRLPKLSGWAADDSVTVSDPAKGGEVFRLVRESTVPGSPRIMILVEPLKTRPTRLAGFLTQSLREMAAREKAGGLQIVRVDQRPIEIGPRSAYRVRHEYTVGTGGTQVAITQVSTLMVLDGRGVAVTAAGRTELFHPLAESIETIIRGMTTPSDGARPGETPQATKAPLAEPIDLGRLGGESEK